jgi:hypothetical protein
MTQWTRTISRQNTNALPAWRLAMSSADTVYEVGGLPSNAGTEIVWPAAGAENYQMVGGVDNNPFYLHASYGGSVWSPERREMIFSATGEASIHHQMTRLTLGEDSPRWRMFQQPTYEITEAAAIASGAAWYYSVADYNALPTGKKLSEAGFASWDGTFPVGFQNWVIRGKYGTSLVGNNIPHWFRYNMPRLIPSSMTGTGYEAIIVNSRGTIYGPFSQGPIPAASGITEGQWFSDMWGSGRRQHFLHAMNVQTGAWQRLSTPIPDFTGYGGDITSPHSCVDRANRRVYYSTYNGSNHALYYASFATGLSGVTISSPANVTDLAGGPAPSQSGNSVLAVPISGANAGRRLWYMKDTNATPAMLLWDLDNSTLRRLTVTGLPSNSEWWGFGYRASTNEVFITTKQSDGIRCYRFTIPTDPTSAGSYSVSSSLLPFAPGVSGVETAGLSTSWQYGERSQHLDELGVICITQRFGKMLAYRPS